MQAETVQSEKQSFHKSLYPLGIAVGAVCATIVYFSTVLSRTIPLIILNTLPNAICIVGAFLLGVWIFKEKCTMRRVFGCILSAVATTVIILF